jgi:O-antigen/teichoic acid export membrane protein
MLSVIGYFFMAVMAMGLDSAQSFYFFEQKEHGVQAQASLVTAILQWRLIAGGLIVLMAIGLSPLLNRVFFDGKLSWVYFAVAFLGFWIMQIGSQNTELFRLTYRPWAYLGLTLTSTITTTAFVVLFVVVLKAGVLGNFMAIMLAALVTILVGWYGIRQYLDWSQLHSGWWRRLLKFGLPLVPAALAMYALQSADRWFITYFLGADALGLFAVGAKFALLIAVGVTTFRQAWWPIAMDALHAEDGPHFLRTSARYYLGAACAAVPLLTAASPWLVRLLTAPAYFSAYPVVGVLAWQAVFYGFFMIVAVGTWKAEKTGWTSVGMTIALAVNVLLDLWWIPRFGILGAAAATSLAFFIWNAFTIYISEKLWPVGYSIGTFAAQLGAGVGGTALIIELYRRAAPMWEIAATTVGVMAIAALATVRRHEVEAAWSRIVLVRAASGRSS